MNANEIKQILDSERVTDINQFEVLKSISAITGDPDKSDQAQELVLRTLEKRHLFTYTAQILEALTRQVGLFPYINPEMLDLRDQIAYEYHRPPHMERHFIFHREQAEIYQRLLAGENVILSAPTSFGKSKIVDAIIATEKYENIVIIVPTLALIDETRRRLFRFSDRYKIVTHLTQRPADRNLFIFTPERALPYEWFPKVEFFVIDEFYKIDALEEDDTRTVALNLAFQKLLKMGGQFYMLGPNIDRIPSGVEEKYRCYFYPTRFRTVISEFFKVKKKGTDIERLVNLCKALSSEQTLIFCGSPAKVDEVAKAMLDHNLGGQRKELAPASRWAAENYHPDWIWAGGISQGIGIHHGRLPRALAQYTVRAFNEGKLQFLVCTSTLIEGVNTKAKNVVVLDNKIAQREIDFFTFNNIAGRSGRMFEHFIGHVYLFTEPPQPKLPFVDFPLFSQDDRTPDSLIVQIDEEDLLPRSLERSSKWSEQDFLPLSLIRQNATIDPDRQIALASWLSSNAVEASQKLAWRHHPSWEQLIFACHLIWEFLLEKRRRRTGVYSSRHLAFRISQLQQLVSTRERIEKELEPGKYAASSPNEAVERVLQFNRNWAGFEFPRLLVALSRIQEYVLSKRNLRHGDFNTFANRVESLFRPSVWSALDEYGIPLELADKISVALDTEEDLDTALKNLKQLDLGQFSLDPFERELILDAKAVL